ncbi:unnamed protein product [Rotaria magnacalcarata]|uniref:TIL domain-containing protein n=1 Tax=Rotaria magnacalcarata TaxID=392030 RepID=A0A816KJ32_9BILA|nr:unnamed protein product [Rotaria magnacalcarata]CAF1921991.1 unnamed protein product [Rotaria magnacalcarata]CAF4450376.1 unnamed protein product [Rotaria magnacalcarata]
MSRILSIFLSFLLASQAASRLNNLTSIIKCGKHEKFTCGSTCIETCTYKPEICVRSCKFGCFCANGYVRQSNKTDSPCIKPAECPKIVTTPICGKNEEYLQCGYACPRSCNELRYPLPKPLTLCAALCKSGCFCTNGYYRAANGQCVLPEKCCGSNERYNTCGSACVETCNEKPTVCTKQCVTGCFCDGSDYVRQSNTTGSACIHRDDCPAQCHENN